MKNILPVVAVLFSILNSNLEADSGYTLVYKKDGVDHPVSGVEDSKLFYTDNGQKQFATQAGEFLLKTEKDADPSLLYYPLNYCIILKGEPETSEKAGGTYRTYLRITDGETNWKSMDVREVRQVWPEVELKNSILLYVWIFEGEVKLKDFTLVNLEDRRTKHIRTLECELEKQEVSGYAGLVLYQDGQVIPPEPLVADEALRNAFISAKRGDTESLKNELEAGLDVNTKDSAGITMLHYATAAGHLGVTQLLMASRADIELKNNDGNTPLMLASGNSRFFIVKELLAHSAKANVKNKRGNAAIHLATYFGHDAVASELIKSGANINLTSRQRVTAMEIAMNLKRNSMVKLLSEAGAKWSQRRRALNEILISMASTGESEIVRYLLKEGADPRQEENGVTALLAAAKMAEPKLLELLISAGAEVNWSNENGLTPLISAANHGNCSAVKYLIENGAEINHQNNAGMTALLAASAGFHLDCVLILLANGADPNIAMASGKTPVEAATIVGSEEIVDALLAAGAECKIDTVERAMPMMEYAFRHDIPQVVRIALDQCLTADFMFYDRFPATWVAQYYGNEKISELLFEHGASEMTSAYPKIKEIKEADKYLEPDGYVEPEYPASLQSEYGDWRVTVEFIINEEGKVLFPRIEEGGVPALNDNVIEAVSRFKFKPVTMDDAPVLVRTFWSVEMKAHNPDDFVYQIKELDKVPKPTRTVRPNFPPYLLSSGIQGRVTLVFTVDEKGNVVDPVVELSSDPLFSEAALEVIVDWKFKPGYLNGEPVKTKIRMPLEFNILPGFDPGGSFW